MWFRCRLSTRTPWISVSTWKGLRGPYDTWLMKAVHLIRSTARQLNPKGENPRRSISLEFLSCQPVLITPLIVPRRSGSERFATPRSIYPIRLYSHTYFQSEAWMTPSAAPHRVAESTINLQRIFSGLEREASASVCGSSSLSLNEISSRTPRVRRTQVASVAQSARGQS